MKFPWLTNTNKQYSTISPEYVSLFDYRQCKWYKQHPHLFHLSSDDTSFWEIGKHYIIEPPVCEGFHMERSEYELKGIIHEYSDVPLNSVVVKKISGQDTLKYTLSKNDCATFNIEYEPQLELLPMSLDWKKEKTSVKTFNSNDFSTTPANPDTGFIHAFTLKISGIEACRLHNNVFYLPQFNGVVEKRVLLENLKLFAKCTVRNAQDTITIWHQNDCINKVSSVQYYHDENGFYLIIDITPESNSCKLKPSDFEGVNINDIVELKLPSNVITPLSLYKKQLQERSENYKQQRFNEANKRLLELQLRKTMPSDSMTSWNLSTITFQLK